MLSVQDTVPPQVTEPWSGQDVRVTDTEQRVGGEAVVCAPMHVMEAEVALAQGHGTAGSGTCHRKPPGPTNVSRPRKTLHTKDGGRQLSRWANHCCFLKYRQTKYGYCPLPPEQQWTEAGRGCLGAQEEECVAQTLPGLCPPGDKVWPQRGSSKEGGQVTDRLKVTPYRALPWIRRAATQGLLKGNGSWAPAWRPGRGTGNQKLWGCLSLYRMDLLQS